MRRDAVRAATRAREVATRAGLAAFGRAPAVVRRRLVRTLAPLYVLGAVVVLRDGDEVLLVRQRHDPQGWTLPGGLLRSGEPPYEAVVREMAEELGLSESSVAVPRHPTCTLVDPEARRVDLVFVVDVATRPVTRPDGDEVTEAAWRRVSATTLTETTAAILALVAASVGPRRSV